MKAEITKKEKCFDPFTLEIRVETPDDLKSLWHRFNVTKSQIAKGYQATGAATHPSNEDMAGVKGVKKELQKVVDTFFS